MTKQPPPYYKNRPDNMSCALACYRSALEHLTGKKYSWKELEAITGFKKGRAAWTVGVWAYLAERGFTIRMVEAFDYERYAKEGQSYLKTFLTPEDLEWYLKHTDLLDIKPLIPKFLKTVKHMKHSPQLSDIDTMLRQGFMVVPTLNSRILNNQSGYLKHAILIYDKKDDYYIAHDPGLTNAQPGRHIPATKLFTAMGGPDNTSEATGIKL
jgi:hypothetical protein